MGSKLRLGVVHWTGVISHFEWIPSGVSQYPTASAISSEGVRRRYLLSPPNKTGDSTPCAELSGHTRMQFGVVCRKCIVVKCGFLVMAHIDFDTDSASGSRDAFVQIVASLAENSCIA
jgi:hypothetical protein